MNEPNPNPHLAVHPSTPGESAAGPLQQAAVLVVDDSRTMRLALIRSLSALGFRNMTEAANGRQALELVLAQPFDLILLDMEMPEMNGMEVLAALKANPDLSELPVIVISGAEQMESAVKCIELGAEDFLPKPFNPTLLRARVTSSLEKKRLRDAIKEKIAYDLRIAREIQMGILPPDVAAVTAGTDLEAHAILEPAQAVGGDLYEVLRTPDGNIVVVMGDVSGKGIPAALFMAVTMTLVRAMSPESRRPEEILRRVSDALVTQNPRNMFVTLLCGIYEPGTGKLTYASAGHPAAVLVRGGQASLLPTEPDLAAGIMAGIATQSQSVDLQPGDLVVFYTDGVTEAFNAAGDLYGDAQLLEALARQSGHGAAETTAALLHSVRGHANGHPQSDDIAILTLRRK